MLIILDTNILISALLSAKSPAADLISLWRRGRFSLVSSDEQLSELMRVTRYPKIAARLSPALAGRLINDLRRMSLVFAELPAVDVSPDPSDNHLLALASAAQAHFLVTGDKRDLLHLGRYAGCRIVSLSGFRTAIGG